MHTALRVEDGKYIAGLGGSAKASNVFMSDGVTSVEGRVKRVTPNGTPVTIESGTNIGTNYVAPSDGWVSVVAICNGADAFVYARNTTCTISNSDTTTITGRSLYASVPASKGDSIAVRAGGTISSGTATFIPFDYS